MPQLFIPHDDRPEYARTTTASGKADSREPLDVPPELRAEVKLPQAEQVASRADENILPQKYQEAVAGKAVSLDARIYELTPAEVFSAVVDAMTSLNLPVESVDSPSGIVTSDWIRRGAGSASMVGMNIFGGSGPAYTRHRFIVRVYLARVDEKAMTKLEIRTLGQSFENRHWVNKPLKRKVSEELFVAVEEQLGRMKAQEGAPAKPAE